MSMEGKALGMLIEAFLASQPSLEDRFLASLPRDMRAFCDETRQMRSEFEENVRRMLLSQSQSEVAAYAAAIARSAHEVGYRWVAYTGLIHRYATYEVPSFRIEVSK
jgi:hypothetical protein